MPNQQVSSTVHPDMYYQEYQFFSYTILFGYASDTYLFNSYNSSEKMTEVHKSQKSVRDEAVPLL